VPAFLDDKQPAALIKLINFAADVGYPALEIWGRDENFDLICQQTAARNMKIASFCGHASLSDGLNNPQNHNRIEDELLENIAIAEQNNIPNLICFSGNQEGRDTNQSVDIIAEGFKRVTEAAENAGVCLNMELLNSKVDHPDYQCNSTVFGVKVVNKTGSDNVKLLYDIYHMQIMEGDLCRTIENNIQAIGHFHTAGNPGRHEMDDLQEINYKAVVKSIIKTGFKGYIAHEFFPIGDKFKTLEEAYKMFENYR